MITLISDPFSPEYHAVSDKRILSMFSGGHMERDSQLQALLIVVTMHTEGLKRRGARETLLQEYPEIKDELRYAMKQKDFRRIRLWSVLWPEQWLHLSFCPPVEEDEGEQAAFLASWDGVHIDAIQWAPRYNCESTAQLLRDFSNCHRKPQIGQAAELDVSTFGIDTPAARRSIVSFSGEASTPSEAMLRFMVKLFDFTTRHRNTLGVPESFLSFEEQLKQDVYGNHDTDTPHVVVVAPEDTLLQLCSLLDTWNDEDNYTNADVESRRVLCLSTRDIRREATGAGKLFGYLKHSALPPVSGVRSNGAGRSRCNSCVY